LCECTRGFILFLLVFPLLFRRLHLCFLPPPLPILPAYAEPSAEPAGLNARIVAMPALSPGLV
jgi:hypothetical protein